MKRKWKLMMKPTKKKKTDEEAQNSTETEVHIEISTEKKTAKITI